MRTVHGGRHVTATVEPAPARLMRAPREEQVIMRDLDLLDREAGELEQLAARADAARNAINERLPKLEHAYRYCELYRAPNGNLVEVRSDAGILAYRALLAVLDGDGELTDDHINTLNGVVPPRPGGEMVKPPHFISPIPRDETARAWADCIEAAGKIEALYQRQADLLDELAARQRGPGERKPYHLIGGGIYGRFEDGVSKMYRPHPERPPVVMLNDWEAAERGANVVALDGLGDERCGLEIRVSLDQLGRAEL